MLPAFAHGLEGARHQIAHGLTGQHPCINAMALCLGQPRLEALHLGLAARKVEHALAAEPQIVAEFLRTHPAVERVSYPGLPDDPGYATAARQMEDFDSIVRFDIAGGLPAGTKFAEALIKGQPAASKIVRTVLKDRIRELT